MKSLFLSFMLLLSASLFSQTTVEEIFSAKLNAKRTVKIKLPPSYGANPERKYPLLLVLDGEYLFSPFEGNLTYGNYWDDMPEVILVGINQSQERYDDSEFELKTGVPSKSGSAFFDFIGTELLPYLDKKFRVAPFK